MKPRIAIMISLLAASPALAGPLGETVKGLNHASGGGSSRPSSSTSSPNQPDSSPSSGSGRDNAGYDHHGRVYRDHREPYYYYWGAPVYVTTVGPDGSMQQQVRHPMTVEIYGGVARVADSDGAMAVDLHLSSERFSIGGRWNHYWEGPSMYYPQGSRLGLWDVDLGYKILGDAQGSLTVEAGVGGVTFSPEATSSVGGMLGARAMFWPSRWFAIFGEARGYLLQDDIRATAYFAGAQAAFLRLGYRVTDFNVGPPLHGPEIGAALRF
jgi:hypothetical protein